MVRFPKSCLSVSLARSGLLRGGTHQLALERVERGCQGMFTCQVTTSSPPFSTGQAGARLSLFTSPDNLPVISGARSAYRREQWSSTFNFLIIIFKVYFYWIRASFILPDIFLNQ